MDRPGNEWNRHSVKDVMTGLGDGQSGVSIEPLYLSGCIDWGGGWTVRCLNEPA